MSNNAKGVFADIAAQNEKDLAKYNALKGRYGFLLGIVAGLGFSIVVWGADTWHLANAHAISPWSKLALGGVPSVILGALLGWIALKIDSLPVSAVLWGAMGVGFGWLAGHIPVEGVTMLLEQVEPALVERVSYRFDRDLASRTTFIMPVTGGIFLLASLFLAYLVEKSMSSNPFQRWWPIVAWLILFTIGGTITDSLINQPFRQPLIVMHNTIQLALDHENVEETETLEKNVEKLESIEGLLNRPRRIILADYDNAMLKVNLLIDFDGTWVRCVMSKDRLDYCKQIGGS